MRGFAHRVLDPLAGLAHFPAQLLVCFRSEKHTFTSGCVLVNNHITLLMSSFLRLEVAGASNCSWMLSHICCNRTFGNLPKKVVPLCKLFCIFFLGSTLAELLLSVLLELLLLGAVGPFPHGAVGACIIMGIIWGIIWGIIITCGCCAGWVLEDARVFFFDLVFPMMLWGGRHLGEICWRRPP